MAESVDAYRYLSFLRSRWLFIAASCGIAMGLALAVSLSLPKKYTAACRILVEPPAGSDVRSVVAVSPIYLESLKTYEHFASSDSMFLGALDHFHLREHYPGLPVESLKASMLKVGMLRDTKILEIQVTLPEARAAHDLAQYLAEATVTLSKGVGQESDRELTEGVAKESEEARERLQKSETAWSRVVAEEPVEALQEEIQSGTELKGTLERQLLRAEQDASDTSAQESPADRARAETLRKQVAQADRDLAAKSDLLARRLADRDRLDAERTASQTAYRTVQGRLDQVRGELGYRGERLRIIDPGIVPERPSSPNIPLNLLAAMLAGIAAPLVYLTLQLSYQAQRGSARRSALRVASTARDATARDE